MRWLRDPLMCTAMRASTSILLLLLSAAVARAEKPVGLPDVDVITVDSAPFSGTFHFVAVDSPMAPKYVYVSDTLRNVIRRKDMQTGVWQVLAGQDGKSGARDGAPGTALLSRPTSLCINSVGAVVFADQGNACIRQVSPSGIVTTLAGMCGRPGEGDGAGQEALFSVSIKSIACLSNCSLLVADEASGRLREVLVHDRACTAAARRAGQPGPSRSSLWLYALGGAACMGLVWLVVGSRSVPPGPTQEEQGGGYSHLEGYSRPSPIGGLVVPAQPLPVLNVSP